jgi:hypothetical protein
LFDRYSGELAVSPRGIAIAGVEQATSGLHRITKDRARRQQTYSNVERRTTMLHPILEFFEG